MSDILTNPDRHRTDVKITRLWDELQQNARAGTSSIHAVLYRCFVGTECSILAAGPLCLYMIFQLKTLGIIPTIEASLGVAPFAAHPDPAMYAGTSQALTAAAQAKLRNMPIWELFQEATKVLVNRRLGPLLFIGATFYSTEYITRSSLNRLLLQNNVEHTMESYADVEVDKIPQVSNTEISSSYKSSHSENDTMIQATTESKASSNETISPNNISLISWRVAHTIDPYTATEESLLMEHQLQTKAQAQRYEEFQSYMTSILARQVDKDHDGVNKIPRCTTASIGTHGIIQHLQNHIQKQEFLLLSLLAASEATQCRFFVNLYSALIRQVDIRQASAERFLASMARSLAVNRRILDHNRLLNTAFEFGYKHTQVSLRRGAGVQGILYLPGLTRTSLDMHPVLRSLVEPNTERYTAVHTNARRNSSQTKQNIFTKWIDQQISDSLSAPTPVQVSQEIQQNILPHVTQMTKYYQTLHNNKSILVYKSDSYASWLQYIAMPVAGVFSGASLGALYYRRFKQARRSDYYQHVSKFSRFFLKNPILGCGIFSGLLAATVVPSFERMDQWIHPLH